MTRSSMWPVQVWSNGRYSKYTLFDREIASGPSFEIDHDYIRDFMAKPISVVLRRLSEVGWRDSGRTSDAKRVFTKDRRCLKIGVGLFGGPARFVLDGTRYDTPDELFAAL